MATRNLPRSLLTSKQSRAAMFSHSPLSQPSGKFAASASASPVPRSSSFLYRLRPLVAAAAPSRFRCLFPGISARAFSTPPTTSSLNDENPNWSDLPPIEPADLPEGCDLEHWLAIMDPPEGDPTRDEIIDGYIKTLAKVVGSEEEARMKIYSLSRYNFAFGALVSEELWDLPKVRLVLPDSYLDVENKIRIME